MGDSLVALLLATPDDERRFALLAEFVTADPPSALAEGEHLLVSADAAERELAAQTLGQVASVEPAMLRNIADTLIGWLNVEPSAQVVAAIVIALGHTEDVRGREPVLGLADHESAEVRDGVAWALPVFGLDDDALAALRRLSGDPDDDVRDWATFALAESDADDAATIEALLARTDDPHDDTRAESIFGLARRHHPAAQALVDRELTRPTVGALIERARDELDA